MSVTSGFFNSLSGDRKYDAIQISSMFDGLITDGIYNGFLESFMVTASSPASMVVTVGEGRCWFNHTWTLNDAPLPLTLDVGDVVLNRIDTIVIDVDSTDTVRACTIKVIKGTPSSQAVRPTLENTETHHQYPLCDISVPAGATTVTQSNITNRRGTSDCPFVATLMKSVNVDDLLIQWESQWNDWMTDRSNAMDSWTAEQQEAFTTWFQTVQDILDENTAGNLLNRINHRTGINATATYSAGVVAITAPDDAGEILTFVAPSDFLSSDTYTLNGEALTITDLNGEALDDSWKKNSPVTITVSGGKAFFKAGGSGKNDTLPPLLGNMTVEVVEGDENDTYTIKMDKLVLDKTTEMVGGAQLEWGEEMPAKPGKGTGGIKTWTRDEVITTGKPYDGLYLDDVTASDAVNEVLLWLPEKIGGKTVLSPFIILSTDYLGGVYVMRQKGNKDWVGKYGNNVTYENSTADTWLASYLNSILDKSIADKVLECEIHVFEQGTIKRKCWIPSYGELYSDFTDSGNTFMPYFNSNGRRALIKQDDGNPLSYWTRTFYDLSNVRMINQDGSGYFQSASNKTAAYRPSFVLPKDFKIQKRPDGSYTVWNEQGLLTLGDIEASNISTTSIVNVTESGQLAPFILLSQKYNEQDISVMHRENLLPESWDSNYSGTTDYATSGIQTKFEEYATSTLDAPYRALLVSVEVTYKNLNPSDNWERKLSTKCCAIGAEEVGIVSGWDLGNIFSYYESSENRKKKHDEGSYDQWYTRDIQSAFYSSNRAWDDRKPYFVSASGTTSGAPAINNDLGLCPMLFFDLTAPIRLLADGTYDLVPEDPALTQSISTMAEAGTPVQLKDIPVSTAGNAVTLKIPETADTYEEYLYGFKNYEDSNAGALVRKDIFAKGNYSSISSSFVNYGGSTLDTSLVDFANNNLDESVKKYLVEVQVQARGGPYPRSCFALSDDELGAPKVSPVYGTAFPYFGSDEARIAQYVGAASSYWRRDTSGVGKGSTGVAINGSGVPTEIYAANGRNGFRPTIAVSLDAWFVKNDDGTYTFAGDEPVDDTPVITYTVEVPHGQKVVFRQFTQNQKNQFQTMLVGGVYPPLGEVEPPFALPEFTGNHAIFGDETAGRIELYESGDLTLYPGTYDFFLVGGGGAGYKGRYNEYSDSTGGGGAGGKTFTQKAVTIPKLTVCPALVGAGGSQSGITVNDSNFSAQAGGGANQSKGGSGGSGGGGGGEERGNVHGGSGGSDGSNGADGYSKTEYHKGGTGQGTTTKSFGEVGGTLYAGGGGGGARSGKGAGAAGGAGGGGNGGNGSSNSGPGTAGTANTGGGGGGGADRYNSPGGAGGSGIIIVRWNRAA